MRLRWNVLDCRWLSRLVLASLVGLVGTASLSAQAAKKDDKNREPIEQLPVDRAKLETRYNKDLKKVIEDLTKGTASAKDNAEAVDVLAQWHTYRVTWPEIQSTPGDISRESHSVMGDLNRFLEETAKNKAATAPLLEAFSTKVAEHMNLVLQDKHPIARLNGARILARLAEVGREEVADVLCETVKEPQQLDGVKYYALKGIRDLVAQANQPNPTVFQSKAGKEREVRCLATASDMVYRKVEITDDMPQDEREALRVMTREAVRILAANRRAAVTDDKGAIANSPALTLLRVARADGFVPEPRMDARVDAAVGLARMSMKSFEGYQPDYAAYQLAWFVTDLAEARRDGKYTGQPWRVHATRLADALEVMKADTSRLKEAKYIGELLDRSLRVLKRMATTDTADPQPITDLLKNKPPNVTLYKNVPDSVIKEGPTDTPAKPADEPVDKEKTDKDKTEKEKK